MSLRAAPLPSVPEQEYRLAELEAWPWRILTLRERVELERLHFARLQRNATRRYRMGRRELAPC